MADTRIHRIQWTETTWNPVTGCDRVSPGCDSDLQVRQYPELVGVA